ncbi:MAG: transposase family protein [Crocosphaera sp.]
MAKGFGKRILSVKEERESKILIRSVLQYFQNIPDPRTGARQDHNLVDIITIAILGVMCGADGVVGLETYGKANQEWLETFLELPNDKVDINFGRKYKI